MSTKYVNYIATKHTENRVRNELSCVKQREQRTWCTLLMKGVLGSRKADGLKWASKPRLFMASDPCARRRMLVPDLKRM